MLYKRASSAVRTMLEPDSDAALFHGHCLDLVQAIPDNSVSLTVSSPPYCMGKEYEPGNKLEDFIEAHEKILPEIVRVTKDGGSICWQIGYYVRKNEIVPLDYIVFNILASCAKDIVLRNRVLWTFGHGLHNSRRFSGRHEMVLWFTKGKDYPFNLDDVRVPQKYPGKKANRGPKQGQFSGNPKGKNPSDVWDIPNVKANHIEKTNHPCQFPVALPQRFIRALTNERDLVLDPYAGACSSGVAALLENRRFIGAEMSSDYCEEAVKRLKDTKRGEVRVRPMNQEVYIPSKTEAVAQRPAHFWSDMELSLV